ncbi:MAG: hypothetical protein QOI51_310 [Nocardioidaceae bacterium]|nr:hypothetical protein [Nocardioidaceae bacterium]
MKNALKNGFVLSVVGAVLIGSVIGWLIFGDHGSNNATAPPGRKAIQISLRRGIYPPLGVALEQPTSWLTSNQGGILLLSSPDAGQTSLAISDPAPAGNDARLRPAINSQLVKTFAPAQVIGSRHGPIGKTPALTTAILGTGRSKHKILILSTAISSAYRTYAVQVFFRAAHPTQQSLLEVRNMLASIRFFAPTG